MSVPATPIETLRELPLPEGGVGLNWLGQAGFVVRAGATTALIDPFLAPWNGRLYESALPPSRAEGVDLVLVTHEHVDHFDASSAPAIAAASPGAVFVVPSPIADMVTEAGVAADRVVGVQPGDDLEVAGLRIRPVPAMHGVTMDDAYGFGQELSGGLTRFLGFVIDAGGVRLYHAGDTIHFEGMETLLRDLAIDVGTAADQRPRPRARGPRHRRQPVGARGRVARARGRPRPADPDALRPVRAEPRLPGAPGRQRRPRPSRRARVRTAARAPVRAGRAPVMSLVLGARAPGVRR